MRFGSFIFATLLISNIVTANETEFWKGPAHPQKIQASALTGFVTSGNASGSGLLGSGAFVLNDKGLIEDVTEKVWLEIQAGPTFVSGGTGTMLNALGRWDFTYDNLWVFYGFGGLTGFFRPSTMGTGLEMRFHFGVGAQYYFQDNFFVRADASYSVIGIGAGMAF